MRKVVVLAGLVVVVIAAQVGAQCPPTELIISEYVEGSSLNKAVELYNGTGSAIDLGSHDYELWIYFNGATTAATKIDLTGTVAAGDVFVICDDGADATILAQCDLQSTASLFNGDDAVVLMKYVITKVPGDLVVDSIGQVGVDPGSQWGTGDVSTQDNTIRRKAAVCTGDTYTGDAFDPASEWDGYANDTFDGLGSHTVVPVELMTFSVE
jgi:uncharacterized protein